MNRRTARAAALMMALSAAWCIAPARAATDDLMEKLRQKTMELQHRKAKPATPPVKPAAKPAEAAVAKAAPSRRRPASDAAVLAQAKSGKGEVRVLWEGACAEHAGLVVRVTRLPIDKAAAIIETLLPAAQPKLSARCGAATSIDAVVTMTGREGAAGGYAMQSADGWRPVAVTESVPTERTLAFTSTRGGGWLQVAADATVRGAYAATSALPGRFDGRVTPGFDPVVKDRVDRWIIDGYWFEFGSSREKCDRSRQGHAYWGAVRWEVPASETVAGIPGLIRPCGEFSDRGRTSPWHLAVAPGSESKPNPFADLSLPNAGDEALGALKSGDGWSIRPGAQLWCDAGAAQLDVIYDAAHEARDAALSGRANGTYDDFVRSQVLPLVSDGCPGALSISLRNVRTGQTVPKDVVNYDVVPGVRDSDVSPAGKTDVRRR